MTLKPKRPLKKISTPVKKKPTKKVVKPKAAPPTPEPAPEIKIPKAPFFLVVTLMNYNPAPGRTINIFEEGNLITTGVSDDLGVAHFPDIPTPLNMDILVQVIGARGVDAEGVAVTGTGFLILNVPE